MTNKSQLIFLHTEPASRIQNKEELTAIGLISEDGHHQFYAEINDTCTYSECAKQLNDWLATLDFDAQLATDDIENDWPVIEAMSKPNTMFWPNHSLSCNPFVINNHNEEGFEAVCWAALFGKTDYAPDNLRHHHALDEVIARRCAYIHAFVNRKKLTPYATIIIESDKALLELAKAGMLNNKIFDITNELIIPDMVRFQFAMHYNTSLAKETLYWIQKNEGGRVLVASTEALESFAHFCAPDKKSCGPYFRSGVYDVFTRYCMHQNHKTIVLFASEDKPAPFIVGLFHQLVLQHVEDFVCENKTEQD